MQIGKRKNRPEVRQVPKAVTGKDEMKGRNTVDLKRSRMPLNNVKHKDMEKYKY